MPIYRLSFEGDFANRYHAKGFLDKLFEDYTLAKPNIQKVQGKRAPRPRIKIINKRSGPISLESWGRSHD